MDCFECCRRSGYYAEHVLAPAQGTIDGVALLSPQGKVLYAVGTLQQALEKGESQEENSHEACRQFAGLFTHHSLNPEKKADRLLRLATASANDVPAATASLACDALPEDRASAADDARGEARPAQRDHMKEGFHLLGQKLAVCRADTRQMLAISAHKGRGLVIHRLASKGGALLLLAFAPARPHVTQRVVDLADRFASVLK